MFQLDISIAKILLSVLGAARLKSFRGEGHVEESWSDE